MNASEATKSSWTGALERRHGRDLILASGHLPVYERKGICEVKVVTCEHFSVTRGLTKYGWHPLPPPTPFQVPQGQGP